MEKIAGIYTRVSTGIQSEDGHSLDTQEALLKDYCRRMDIKIYKVYQEAGTSGGIHLKKRPKGANMVADIEAGKINTVVVQKVDRLGRSVLDLMSLIDYFDAKGVDLHILDLNINTSSPSGRFMLQIMGALGEMERNMIKDRTQQSMDYLKQNDMVRSRSVLGFDRKGNKLVVNEQEMELVKRIHKMYKDGKSLSAIARTLNEEGIASKEGKKFYHTTIKIILTNSAYQRYIADDIAD